MGLGKVLESQLINIDREYWRYMQPLWFYICSIMSSNKWSVIILGIACVQLYEQNTTTKSIQNVYIFTEANVL